MYDLLPSEQADRLRQPYAAACFREMLWTAAAAELEAKAG